MPCRHSSFNATSPRFSCAQDREYNHLKRFCNGMHKRVLIGTKEFFVKECIPSLVVIGRNSMNDIVDLEVPDAATFWTRQRIWLGLAKTGSVLDKCSSSGPPVLIVKSRLPPKHCLLAMLTMAAILARCEGLKKARLPMVRGIVIPWCCHWQR